MMTELDDISGILGSWPFDAARIQARMTTGADGRPVIQLRVDLGVLQMERDGRPDGTRPGGFSSSLRRCRALIEEAGEAGETAKLSGEDFPEIDRELLQYHHRRMALFSLGDYARAARDADHSLELLRLVQEHSDDEAYIAAHEKSFPFVLMERARARVLLALRKRRPRTAVFHVEEGVRLIQEHVRRAASEAGERTINEILFLRRWARKLRRAHGLEPPLERQLDAAVGREDYEEAARLRDEIRRKTPDA
jgi:hypothetical protein